jgi:hypothetical protein
MADAADGTGTADLATSGSLLLGPVLVPVLLVEVEQAVIIGPASDSPRPRHDRTRKRGPGASSLAVWSSLG